MRIFKTKWFAREASSHGISDDELYQAIQSALQGKVVDLGGGVYKKRLNKNRELMGFRELAKHYANLSEEKTTALVKSKELVEICDDSKK
ncbi:TPA: type II toxin-antitoxin system RelE/ParE family toxin [Klebsiella aerogenes]|uniref:type II toxin-antitoxin system RelE/ParE family toxin n=1 Tax=Klebsiella aerogenes TaxID=548 RepID=UPI0022EC4740|nr:type II toxin-antitoxin system RelE/ParE family toxin [Klebsiella aerogenes]MDA3992871.1 type II toxin-antitoxin system RelE/ParE family toxin [Klebsiella aerogenes]HDS6595099.1 type II toxin-antitoxin system RelE/ParE family toxin [Klebsiella aerogenes]HDU6301653.1 type II toxin-antitoxin system RelE/ParE family toxin [Klebsiella aerogenes]